MHQTSECTLRAMLRLMRELPAGVTVLPVFDALVCREEDADRVASAMVEAFRDVSGADVGKVGIK